MNLIYKIKRFVLDIIFPNRCPFCSKIIEWNKLGCKDCLESIEYIESDYCHKCGQDECECERRKLYYDGCESVAYYFGTAKKGIYNLKDKHSINMLELYFTRILKRLTDNNILEKIDMIIPVPMTKSDIVKRGFNQADEIALIISKKLSKKHISNVLLKPKNRLVQHGLSFKERQENVKGLFLINNKKKSKIIGKTILLCDDVLTTGNTLSECAKILKENGVSRVYCITLTKTKYK